MSARTVSLVAAMLEHVLLAADHVDQVPDDVEQGFVRLLDAWDTEAGDGEAVVTRGRHPPAVATGKADGQHPHLARRLERAIHISGLATGGYPQRHVAASAEQSEL